jgi:hypothetical protein
MVIAIDECPNRSSTILGGPWRREVAGVAVPQAVQRHPIGLQEGWDAVCEAAAASRC